ncbi:MAG: hypothetical protein ACR2FS_13500, partial [Phormidesmis sp.]
PRRLRLAPSHHRRTNPRKPRCPQRRSAEEERNGLIRWLRPDYQAPNEAIETQPTLEGITPEEKLIIEPVEQQKWPTKPKEQLAAIRGLLHTTPGEWSAKQIAAQFKGRTTQKKLDAITENLQRLECLGLVICDQKSGHWTWHYADFLNAPTASLPCRYA